MLRRVHDGGITLGSRKVEETASELTTQGSPAGQGRFNHSTISRKAKNMKRLYMVAYSRNRKKFSIAISSNLVGGIGEKQR